MPTYHRVLIRGYHHRVTTVLIRVYHRVITVLIRGYHQGIPQGGVPRVTHQVYPGKSTKDYPPGISTRVLLEGRIPTRVLLEGGIPTINDSKEGYPPLMSESDEMTVNVRK